MTDLFKPMLATDAELEKLRFPLLASAKLDGVRAVVRDGIVYSRSNKPLPNKFIQEKFKHLEHFDGELIYGDPCAKDCYRRTTSAVMSHESTDGCDVSFYVFDHILHLEQPYFSRIKELGRDRVRGRTYRDYIIHPQHHVICIEALLTLEEKMLDLGYEGLILRDPNAPYKRGRSTAKEQYLLKLKRFVDAEAVVIGFEERMHNGNEATTNELGRTKRSSHQAGKIGRGDLGALICRFGDIEFNIGTGFSDDERAAIWRDKDKYHGRLAKFKHFAVGAKDAPRHPVFLGWRDPKDMS